MHTSGTAVTHEDIDKMLDSKSLSMWLDVWSTLSDQKEWKGSSNIYTLSHIDVWIEHMIQT